MSVFFTESVALKALVFRFLQMRVFDVDMVDYLYSTRVAARNYGRNMH